MKRATPASGDWEVAAVYHPGDPGIRRLEKQWGEKLVCVRYRYNAAQAKRRTTVEIVVEEAPWRKRRATEVGVEVRSWEGELRKAVLEAGGRWDGERKVWLVSKRKVRMLGLDDKTRERKPSPKPQPPKAPGRR